MESTKTAIRRCLQELASHIEGLQNEYDILHSEHDELRKRHSVQPLRLDGVVDKSKLDIQGRHSSVETVDLPGDLPGKVDVSSERLAKFGWSASTGSQDTTKSERQKPSMFAMPKQDHAVVTLAATRLGMLKKPGHHADKLPEEPEHGERMSVVDAFREELLDPLMVRHGGDWSLRASVEGYLFKVIVLTAILANTIHTGVRLDFQMKNNYRRVLGQPQEEDWHYVADIAFTSFFTAELLLRLLAEKKDFFTGENLNLNIVDSALVILGLVEIAGTVGTGIGFILRMFRMFRVTRLVRLVKSVKLLRSLRTMIFSLLNAWTMLVWATVVISITIFVFGVLFGGGVVTYYESLDLHDARQVENAKRVHDEFGSLYQMMVALFCAITGGNDWYQYAATLRLLQYGEFYFVVFTIYISFSVVGMLNVVTGLFVDSAVCTRTQDEIVQDFNDDYVRTASEVRQIFGEADKDATASISFQELAKHLRKPWVKAYFAGLNIDPSEAQIIFTLMDTDGSEVLTLEEFVEGVMKMKGNAKSIDLLSLMFDQARFNLRFNTLCSFLEDELREIKKVVAPSSVADRRMFSTSATTLAEINKFSKLRYPTEGLDSAVGASDFEELAAAKQNSSSRLMGLVPGR
eukprot:TRINITY_DN2462_c0_g1_i3.p1 TRINITY_DN2462_c0_g1~~TRINITY_DN2462_c0_g1_i3.p1  ORF type:complete len:632 (-),score=107.71 TRINITY_DN2462_c0_g1_i3:290-2185(-)